MFFNPLLYQVDVHRHIEKSRSTCPMTVSGFGDKLNFKPLFVFFWSLFLNKLSKSPNRGNEGGLWQKAATKLLFFHCNSQLPSLVLKSLNSLAVSRSLALFFNCFSHLKKLVLYITRRSCILQGFELWTEYSEHEFFWLGLISNACNVNSEARYEGKVAVVKKMARDSPQPPWSTGKAWFVFTLLNSLNIPLCLRAGWVQSSCTWGTVSCLCSQNCSWALSRRLQFAWDRIMLTIYHGW